MNDEDKPRPHPDVVVNRLPAGDFMLEQDGLGTVLMWSTVTGDAVSVPLEQLATVGIQFLALHVKAGKLPEVFKMRHGRYPK